MHTFGQRKLFLSGTNTFFLISVFDTNNSVFDMADDNSEFSVLSDCKLIFSKQNLHKNKCLQHILFNNKYYILNKINNVPVNRELGFLCN